MRIIWLDAAATLEENLEVMRETPYSNYPVYRGGEHEILGVLEVKRVIGRIALGTSTDLFATLVKPLFVPATARAFDLLEEFRDSDTPLALVVDEYGDIEGVVTLNDLLSAVVGKSATPRAETRDHPIVQREDGSWLVDGSVGTDDLRELLELTDLPNEDEHDFRTAAGMVKAPCHVLPPVEEGAALCGLMGRMGLVVSMRLHALVFACAQQTRVAAISYDPKVSGFMSYLGSDCCVELDRLTEQELKTMLDRAMAQDTPHQVGHLKALANENGILAGELLRM
jgi:CBS domain containing-hemolysin-like protein